MEILEDTPDIEKLPIFIFTSNEIKRIIIY